MLTYKPHFIHRHLMSLLLGWKWIDEERMMSDVWLNLRIWIYHIQAGRLQWWRGYEK